MGHGADVRLWGRMGGGVSGCSESLTVLSFSLPLYSTSLKLNLQPFKIAITIFIASNSKSIIYVTDRDINLPKTSHFFVASWILCLRVCENPSVSPHQAQSLIASYATWATTKSIYSNYCFMHVWLGTERSLTIRTIVRSLIYSDLPLEGYSSKTKQQRNTKLGTQSAKGL